MRKVVIPCSGIGKAFGAVAREATFRLTDSEHSNKYQTICLPLLMTDDDESMRIVVESDVYTIDGCPKRCASSLVRHAKGNLVMELMVPKILAENKDHKPGSVLDIGEGGSLLAEDIMKTILNHGGTDE